MLPDRSRRAFATDMTTLLTTDALGKAGNPVPEIGITSASYLFDAIANARSLSVVLATTPAEDADPDLLEKRLCESFKDLRERAKSSRFRLSLETTFAASFTDWMDYVRTCLEIFRDNLVADQQFHAVMLAWLKNNRAAGGDLLRKEFSFSRDEVEQYRPEIESVLPAFGFDAFLYCLDFILKFDAYLSRTQDFYVGSAERASGALRLSGVPLESVDAPISIAFREAVRTRLNAGAFKSFSHFMDVVLATQNVVEDSGIHGTPHADRAPIAREIFENCHEFWPELSVLERDRGQYENALKRVKSSPQEAFQDWVFDKVKDAALGEFPTNIKNEILKIGVGVVSHVSAHLPGVLCPLADHLLVKLRRATGLVMSPYGVAFEVMTMEGLKTFSANTDVIRVNDAARIRGFAPKKIGAVS